MTAVLAPRLSPSRASDFKSCPLKFKLKVVDGLVEPPSIYTLRGTTVHGALEKLFLLPRHERSRAAATALWEDEYRVAVTNGEVEALFGTDDGAAKDWADSCRRVVGNYFQLEDPTRLEPAGRELRLEADLPGTPVRVRGILDRVDRCSDGSFVISDYKTGSPPSLQYANKNFFGLIVYAWLFRETFGATPTRLRLLFLDNPGVLSLDPGDTKVDAMVRQLGALWKAASRNFDRDDWRPRPGPLCPFCAFQDLCPVSPLVQARKAASVELARAG